jgi:hypothetical protein
MSKGIASLARQVASKGRGGDSTLLHIHPSELEGMRKVLHKVDPNIRITLNPETGMYEAWSWKKTLAAIGLGAAAAGLIFFTGGFGAPVAGKVVATGGAGLLKGATATALLKGVAIPALIAGAGSTAVSAFAPDQKKESQKALTELDQYKAASLAQQEKNIRIPLLRPANAAPTISQATTAQPAPVSTSTTTAQPTGIGSVLSMGATSKSQPTTVPQKGIASVFQPSIASAPVVTEEEEEDVSGYAEGGSLEPEEQKARQIVQDAMEAIRGEGDDPEGSLNTYLAYYGKDALQDLYKRMSGKEEVEEEDNYEPPEGMIKGPGNGMDDMATARMARGGQKVLLSNDEFIIPADVVSGLGDGSSESGARKLYAMMDRVRMDRTGNKKQPGKVKDVRVLPA